MGSRNDTEVTIHEFNTADLEAFLHNFGSKLINAVIVGIVENVVDDTALVGWGTMLAQVLDTPIAELTMSDEVDVCDHFLDSRALQGDCCQCYSTVIKSRLTFSSSTQFSKMFCTTKLPVSPSATSCHIPRRASLTLIMI